MNRTMSERLRWGRIPDGVRRSKLSRGKLYGLAAKHKGLFRKADAATIVDLEFLDQILEELPVAEINSDRAKTSNT
jgi:hypothetical protein